MMPFSVLRIWGLGLFGWALLVGGLYLATLTYQEFQKSVHTVERLTDRPITDNDRSVSNDSVAPHNRVEPSRSEWPRWALLAGAIACLGTSFGGYWPVRFLLGNPETESIATILPSRTLSVDRPEGSKLHIEIYGEDNRPTLLFTHGWTLDSSAWDYVKPDLVKHFRLVMWDLAGLGKSTRPDNRDHSIEKMANDLAAVITVTAPPEGMPLFLVGHSIGGMIQQTFCRLHAELLHKSVQGMVLVHTTYTNPVRTNLAHVLMTVIEKPILVPLNYLTIALAPLVWLSNWQSYFNGSLHVSSRFTSFSGKQTRRQLDHGARLLATAWPATVGRGNFAMTAFDEERTLPGIDIPVLVLGGLFDRLTISAASDHIGTLLPRPQNIRIQSGHFGPWELNHSTAKAIHEFATANSMQFNCETNREKDDLWPATVI